MASDIKLSQATALGPLDRIIERVSPSWALNRMEARSRIASAQLMAAAYDAASMGGHRTQNWLPTTSSPDEDTRDGLDILRARARELRRNNAYAKRAVNLIASAIRGGEPIIRIQHTSKAQEARFADAVREWLNTEACSVDGRRTFAGMIGASLRETVDSGEALVQRVFSDDPDLPLPIQLRTYEAEHLDCTLDANWGEKVGEHRLPAHAMVSQGVEMARGGRRLAYWILRDHPGDSSSPFGAGLGVGTDAVRVPAADIIHHFAEQRLGAARSVPWGSACLIELRDLGDFKSAELWKAKIAACMVAFVRSADTGLGSLSAPPPDGSAADQALEVLGQMKPGMIYKSVGSEGVDFSHPPVHTAFDIYSRMSLLTVAAGYNVPYEMLAGDWKSVTFSSGKMADLGWRESVRDWRADMYFPLLLNRIGRWLVGAAMLKGILRTPARVTWANPARPYIQPEKEVKAALSLVAAGAGTRSELIRRAGGDPEELFAELAAETDRLRELGVPTQVDGLEVVAEDQDEDEETGDEK